MFEEAIEVQARAVLDLCRSKGLRVATAESLTGGLIAGALTAIAGSSDVVDRAFVTYSYEAKSQLLGVPYALVEACGAVSEEVARRMAEGALAHGRDRVQLTVAVTGVAGPGASGPGGVNPAGLVHLASAREGFETKHRVCHFGDVGRGAVRLATVREALSLLLEQAAR